mmetsp:Transcript_18732/g.47463  ORF Transcript_18732/g.47463 Transcript_18732/m.47463 type:complete len:124 (-) Transcript_18732:3314-3685(-)
MLAAFPGLVHGAAPACQSHRSVWGLRATQALQALGTLSQDRCAAARACASLHRAWSPPSSGMGEEASRRARSKFLHGEAVCITTMPISRRKAGAGSIKTHSTTVTTSSTASGPAHVVFPSLPP